MEAQTQTPAINQQIQAATSGLQTTVTGFVESVRVNLPIIQDKVMKAKAALSMIKEITTAEQDTEAEKILSRVRPTFELVQKLRMEGTSMLDSIKAQYMEPEKEISTDPKATDSEYNRVRGLRNAWAKAEHEKQQKAIAEAAAERARREEIARLGFEYQTAFSLNINNLVTQLRRSLETFVNGLTLETFETAEQRLNVKPNIKRETFESWFGIQTSLTPDQLEPVMKQIREQYTYERINGNYLQDAEPMMKEYRDKLPGIKKGLEEVAHLAATNAAAAAALKQKQADDAAAALKVKEDAAAAQAKAAAEDAERNANVQKMDAAFGQQLVLQENAGVKGAKVKKAAVVDCPPAEIARVMAEVMYHCFLSPKFQGVFKLEKGTVNRVPADTDGVPIYQKWADELLTFYADNCSADEKAKVAGINFVDRVTTVARAK